MKRKSLSEATTTGGSGKYKVPLNLAPRIWKNEDMEPFNIPVSHYLNPDNAYDSYDGKMSNSKKNISKKEKTARKIYNYIKNNPNSTTSDEEGNPINQFPGKSNIVPIKEWVELDEILTEDLAVWFGTKKKPKGSKQPKGPWVNICRKVDGKHPPCGRPDADSKGYPKCRAAGVAGKMSDSEKKSACQQKRNAEKKDTQTGKGQKPIMTSYKPKKKKTQKESLEMIVRNILSGL
jgi:hypothetical protein